MKIAITSDVHLEFGDLDLHNNDNADVLILGGDIFVAEDLKGYDGKRPVVDRSVEWPRMVHHMPQSQRIERYIGFIDRCVERFPQVIFIMGNHEHYHGDYAHTADIIRTAVGSIDNFHFLDNQSCVINNVVFFGGTLWTDMNQNDPETLDKIKFMMNDFRGVKNSNRLVQFRGPDLLSEEPDAWQFKERAATFAPQDTVEEHQAFLSKLDDALAQYPNQPFVVVGHHAPSKESTHPRYKKEYITNGAYSSNLNDFILDRRQIKLWTHGHTHEDFDYMIGTTRVICNPRGYDGYEDRADRFELKCVEI